MFLKNYMEDLVWQQLDEVIQAYPEACTCSRCRYDVAALALNFLPTRYVVTDKGETYARIQLLEQQFYVDVVASISRAITIVKTRPRHDVQEESLIIENNRK